jgi:hypothetical protein
MAPSSAGLARLLQPPSNQFPIQHGLARPAPSVRRVKRRLGQIHALRKANIDLRLHLLDAPGGQFHLRQKGPVLRLRGTLHRAKLGLHAADLALDECPANLELRAQSVDGPDRGRPAGRAGNG